MNKSEFEQPQDTDGVEIVPLVDLEDDRRTHHKPLSVLSHFPLALRFSPRQRRLQVVITTSILLIILLVVLGTSLPVRNLPAHLWPALTLTPRATIAPGTDLFYIRGNLPWAHILLDGHRIAHLPIIGVDPPFRLAPGHHELVWSADPFSPQVCTIAVPLAIGAGICQVNDSVQLQSGLSAWIINFSASLVTLSNVQRTALVHAAQAALDAQRSTETVQVGELYDAPSQSEILHTQGKPLQATLHFQLDTDITSNFPCVTYGHSGQACSFFGVDCHVFCTNPEFAMRSPFNEWNVFGVVLPVWDYATLDGRSMARNQPDGSGGAIGDEFLAPLRISWGSDGWHVTSVFDNTNTHLFSDPTCAAAKDDVQLDTALWNVQLNNTDAEWHFASGAVHAAGCLAVAVPKSGEVHTPLPFTPTVAYCLHRFGVLLAANEVAHQLWPYLPVADAYERNLARLLAPAIAILP